MAKNKVIDNRTRGDVVRFPGLYHFWEIVKSVALTPVLFVTHAMQRVILGKEGYARAMEKAIADEEKDLILRKHIKNAQAIEKEINARLSADEEQEIVKCKVRACRTGVEEQAYKFDIVLENGTKLSLFSSADLAIYPEPLCPASAMNRMIEYGKTMSQRIVGIAAPQPELQDEEPNSEPEEPSVPDPVIPEKDLYESIADYKQGNKIADIVAEGQPLELVGAIKKIVIRTTKNGAEMAQMRIADVDGREIDAVAMPADFAYIRTFLNTDSVMRFNAVSIKDKSTGEIQLMLKNIHEAELLTETEIAEPVHPISEVSQEQTPESTREPALEDTEKEAPVIDFATMTNEEKLALRFIIAEESKDTDPAKVCAKYGITLEQLGEIDELAEREQEAEAKETTEKTESEKTSPVVTTDDLSENVPGQTEKNEIVQGHIQPVLRGDNINVFLKIGDDIKINAERKVDDRAYRLTGDLDKLTVVEMQDSLKEIARSMHLVNDRDVLTPGDGAFASDVERMIREDIKSDNLSAAYVYGNTILTVDKGEKAYSVHVQTIGERNDDGTYTITAEALEQNVSKYATFSINEKYACRDAVLSAYTVANVNPRGDIANPSFVGYKLPDGNQAIVCVGGKNVRGTEGAVYELETVKAGEMEYVRIINGKEIGKNATDTLCRAYIPDSTTARENADIMGPQVAACLRRQNSTDVLVANGVVFTSEPVEEHEKIRARMIGTQIVKDALIPNGFESPEQNINTIITGLLSGKNGIGYSIDDGITEAMTAEKNSASLGDEEPSL